MNLSIVGSFIIGGLLMLSIIYVNVRVTTHSGQETMQLMAKTNVDVISQVLTFDLRKIGYGNGAEITSATNTSISFSTDLNNDGNVIPVSWQFTPSGTLPTDTDPGAGTLVRLVNGVSEDFSSMIVTRFEFQYILEDGSEVSSTASVDQIRKIRANVICNTEFSYDGVFGASAWQNVITPININL